MGLYDIRGYLIGALMIRGSDCVGSMLGAPDFRKPLQTISGLPGPGIRGFDPEGGSLLAG